MSDLPRYHRGALGPIDFAKFNDMMQRLDRMLPLLEDPSTGKPYSGASRLNPFVVATTGKVGTKWEWVELTLDESGNPVYDETDDPSQFQSGRRGLDADGTSASCIDVEWNGGRAICFALNQQDGIPGYVLCPLVESEAQQSNLKMVYVQNVLSDIAVTVDDDGDQQFDFNIYAMRYECREVLPPNIGNPNDLTIASGVQVLYDFGYDKHDPGLLNGNTVPSSYSSIPYGSLRLAFQLTSQILCIAGLPRLDYNCP